ncbi:hypothetical protein Droror1_Dr00020950 [Drosera rotundifolia]
MEFGPLFTYRRQTVPSPSRRIWIPSYYTITTVQHDDPMVTKNERDSSIITTRNLETDFAAGDVRARYAMTIEELKNFKEARDDDDDGDYEGKRGDDGITIGRCDVMM